MSSQIPVDKVLAFLVARTSWIIPYKVVALQIQKGLGVLLQTVFEVSYYEYLTLRHGFISVNLNVEEPNVKKLYAGIDGRGDMKLIYGTKGLGIQHKGRRENRWWCTSSRRKERKSLTLSLSAETSNQNRAFLLQACSRSTGLRIDPDHVPQLRLFLSQLPVTAFRRLVGRTRRWSTRPVYPRFDFKLDISSYQSPLLTKLHPQAHLNVLKLPEVALHGGATRGGGWKPDPIKSKTEASIDISRATGRCFECFLNW
uniref:Uncharacterized protein n=1 Tax=Rosa rugosa TaxID=74645 RepID=J7G2W8_ROSRU|nr:hypothetical protein [Rosa rugosa]